jgi:predicted PurR-regulated permease PerM
MQLINRGFLRRSAGSQPKTPTIAENPPEPELIPGPVKAAAIAQIVIASAAAIGLIYLLKVVLVTILISLLLAFALDPLVVLLARLRIPRAIGAAVGLLLLLCLVLATGFFFYNRAIDFIEELPQYSSTIRENLRKLEAKAEKLESNTRNIIPEAKGRRPIPVEVQDAPGLTKIISSGATQYGDLALAIGFVPFLIYFMLTWKAHVHSATLHIFPSEQRPAAYRTIGRISEMVRSFIVGNLIVGLLNALASTVVFWYVGLPYFYFLGIISAFLGLVPYLGLFFALFAPIAAGMGVITKGHMLVVFVTVILLHILGMNLLYPKLIGRRLRLNPLAVALSLLFWGWIWGALGLVLAVPLMASAKIVCDYIEPLRGLAQWLGD